VIVTWFYPDQPGFLDFSYRIRTLSQHYDVILVSRAPISQRELLVPGISYVVLPTQDCGTTRHVRYVLMVGRFLRRTRPDLVMYLGSQIAGATHIARNIPSAVYWNEHPSHYFSNGAGNLVTRGSRAILRALTYRGAARAQVVMPIGEAHAADLGAHGVPALKVRVIHMGVSSRFAAIGQTRSNQRAKDFDRPLELIYTGTVMKERGRDVMLEALALVNRHRVRARLTFVGALPDQFEYCNRRASELGISQQIHVVGRISGDEVPEALALADIGLCIWEDKLYWRFNPPTKLFEYLVAGLPVLASRIQTHTAYIRDWENGLIFEYNAESLAQRISEIWKRRDCLAAFSARAAASGRRYLWESIEPQFLQALPDADIHLMQRHATEQ